MQEGIRKRIPTADWKRLADDDHADVARDRLGRKTQEMINRVQPFDQATKRLTGYSPETYAAMSAIDRFELFPEDAKILNIGDPWQRLDLPGVTTLEYASGEEAAFFDKPDQLYDFVKNILNQLVQIVQHLNDSTSKSLLEEKIRHFQELHEQHQSKPNFPRLVEAARALEQSVYTTLPNHEDYNQRYAWYYARDILRACTDTEFVVNVLEPQLEHELIKDGGWSDMTRADRRQQIIAEHRWQKKYVQAELVRGTFPDTDFPDKSFDRIIASWSISAHMFNVMQVEDFILTFNEIDRLLKVDGAAYLWPINYGATDSDIVSEALISYRDHGGMFGFVVNNSAGQSELHWGDTIADHWINDNWNEIVTLIILPRHADQNSRQRIAQHVEKDHVKSIL